MNEFKRIQANEAHELLAQGNTSIVDIRDAMSFKNGRIINAQHIDNSNVDQFIAGTDLESPLIVCCYHGNSSQNAAQYFASQGFKQVFSLDGGFEQWKVIYPADCEH